MGVFVFVIILLSALVLVSGAYVFFTACRRKRELPWLDANALKGTIYERYSDYIQNANKWLQTHCPEDIFITSEDGLKLHGLWIPAENPRGTILLAHGYRSSILVDFGMVFDVYHKLNMNLLVPQQRAHGQSEGKYITFGVKESQDMISWIKYHNANFGNKKMIISGLSMGASTMMYLADRKLPENVKGIIVDCGFTSPAAIISCVFRSVIHLPAIPVIWAADLFARIFAKFSLYEKDSRMTLANSRLPIMMVHGLEDDFVPAYMTQQGYDACASEKQLLMVKDAEHGVSFLKEPDRYKQMISQFLDKYIGGTL